MTKEKKTKTKRKSSKTSIATTEQSFQYTTSQPFKCPVCNGEGITSFPSPETKIINAGKNVIYADVWPCHACKGTGIVWSGGSESPLTFEDEGGE